MPASSPVGGGVDGPQYADYQDSTDQQQLAGAATSMREKLMVMQDTLVLDIAKFSGGDIKSYAAKAQAPTVPMYIKLRSTGPMETTDKNIEQFEAEFMKILEQLPAKLRMLLLKNMNLPKGQRNPELDGLEEAIKQQIEIRQWAKGILKRFRGGKEKEGDEEEHKGVFSLEEEEELIPEGTVIPKAHYVPIAAVDPLKSSEDVAKQIQSNCVFVAECQLGILNAQLKQMAVDDPSRALLSSFPKLIKRMIEHSRAFVNFVSYLGYTKAKKAAVGLKKLHVTLVDEQRQLLEKAGRYGEGGPSSSSISFALGILSIVVVCCSMLRSDAKLGTLHMRGAALSQALMLSSGTLAGEKLTHLYHALGGLLETVGLESEDAKVVQLATLMTLVMIPLLTAEEALPYLVAYIPDAAEGLSTAFKESDEAKEEATKKIQEVARTAAVQLALATNIAADLAERAVESLIEMKSEGTASLIELIIVLVTRLTGQAILEKVGGTASELYAKITFDVLLKSASKLQEWADKGAFKSSITEAINELRLSELPFESYIPTEQMAGREKALKKLGIGKDDLKTGSDELAVLIASLAYSLTKQEREQKQVVPSVNVIV